MNKIYLASIFILVAFYIPLIYLIGHPNVSAEYKSYYITQSSKISPFERANMGPIPFGEKIEFNDRRIGFENFFDPGKSFRWSMDAQSQIIFLLDSQDKLNKEGTLLLRVDPLGAQKVSLALNQKLIYEGMLNGPTELLISYPAGSLKEGMNTITLLTPGAKTLGDGEIRKLALRFQSLVIE
jgi:hypothetical protein